MTASVIVDLHTHAAPGSGDAQMTIGELADAAACLGVEAVALTDHGVADIQAAREVLESYGIGLIPGREVTCDLGHVLVLAIDEAWLASLPPRCPLPLPNSRRGPCALVWAHPAGWRYGGTLIPPDPSRGGEHVHAIELLNGERLYQPGGVTLAGSLAAELGLSRTGGSDAHGAPAVGRCLTEVAGATDPVTFIEGLAAGTAQPILSRTWAQARGYDYARADLIPYLR